MQQKAEMTANEFVNVKDIRETILYSKDGYMFGYIHIGFLNLELLSDEEKDGLTRQLAASFENDKRDFVYVAYPRELDLDVYKSFLKEKHRQEMTDLGRKKILEELLIGANEMSSSGENYEHQHFIKLWAKYEPDKRNCEYDFKDRMQSFAARYMACGISAEILGYKDIIKLCNLFGNPQQAPYDQESDTQYQERLAII